MNALEIKYIPIEKINPSKYNPRDISDSAFEGLKESIKKFGMVDPLIVNARTGILVGGHQRLKAAESLCLKTVPVVEVNLSPSEEKALNVTLNNAKISGFYTDTLQDLLDEIKLDFGDDFMVALQLDSLVLQNSWDFGLDVVDNISANLDGIKSKIIVKCPQEIKEKLLDIIKDAIKHSSLDGVEID